MRALRLPKTIEYSTVEVVDSFNDQAPKGSIQSGVLIMKDREDPEFFPYDGDKMHVKAGLWTLKAALAVAFFFVVVLSAYLVGSALTWIVA